MASKKEPEKPRPVSLRLPPELFRLLDVARLATGHKSMQSFLAELVEQSAAEYLKKPEFQLVLQSLNEFEASEAGTLRWIDTPPKKPRQAKA